MSWKDTLKQYNLEEFIVKKKDSGMLGPTYIKGKDNYPSLVKKLEKLIAEWKPEQEEGKAYLDDLIKVVSNSCPEGTEWDSETMTCKLPEKTEVKE